MLAAGLAYSLGRALTYVIVGALAVSSVLSIPGVSFFLQKRMNQVLGPLLVLVGIGLLVRLPFKLPTPGWSQSLQERTAGAGLPGAAGLGLLFALSFCPVSAGLFFGGLIPLATGAHSRLLLPALYGIGTGLPVVVTAVMLTAGLRRIGGLFQALTRVERAARPVTGIVFVLAGLWLGATHLFGVDF